MPFRCPWAGSDPLYIQYHDEEWGVPCRDDRKLFEFLILEGAQAGLSWITILRKREAYSKAFAGFNPEKVARYGEKEIQALLANPGIIRNKLKIRAAVDNARACLDVQEEFGSFGDFIWRFVDGKPIKSSWENMELVPASTEISEAMSRDLKNRGFKFVGPVICYSFMQAMGMVNDHLVDCFRYDAV